jgi:hypothetical protein
MVSEKVARLIAQLKAPLTATEASAGWTQEIKERYIPYFEGALMSLETGKPIQYVALARSLDASGIGEGGLYTRMMDVANDLDDRPS